jgi:hypothetical protein
MLMPCPSSADLTRRSRSALEGADHSFKAGKREWIEELAVATKAWIEEL